MSSLETMLEDLRAALALSVEATADDIAGELERRCHGTGSLGAPLRATAAAIRNRAAADHALATHGRDALAALR